MNILMSNFRLTKFYSTNPETHLQHGDLVCPANGAKSIGIITNITKGNDGWRGDAYTVLWGAPKTKRGKVSSHLGTDLVDVKRYLAAFEKESNRINALIDEAKTVGL